MSSKKLPDSNIISRLDYLFEDFFGLGYKNKNIARRTKIPEATISRLLNGNRGLTIETAIKICKTFNVNLHWLLTGEGNQKICEGQQYHVAMEPLVEYGSEFDSRYLKAVRSLKGDFVSQGQVIRIINNELTGMGEQNAPAGKVKKYTTPAHGP